MAIQSNTVTSKAIRIKSPNAVWFDATGVTYTLATGQAVFKLSRTFTSADSGTWQIWTSPTDKVLDTAGNGVVGDVKIGEFIVNIPAPTDTTPPTVTLNSITPASITTAGNTEVNINVTYAD